MGDDTYLRKVILCSNVYVVCLQHALTTEKEEVMGLLIGEVDEENFSLLISASLILHRSDKQPDRVEISPEQLCKASEYAEELALKTNRPMRVLGWYHSHPHITVWPSHVDLRTQAAYQMMDPLFVGLIFSVYQSDRRSIENNEQLTAFQALRVGTGGELERREIFMEIKNTAIGSRSLESMLSLPQILCQEEAESHKDEGDNNVEDQLTILHNDGFRTMRLVNVVSKVTRPLCEDLEARLHANNARIRKFEKLKKELLDQLNL